MTTLPTPTANSTLTRRATDTATPSGANLPVRPAALFGPRWRDPSPVPQQWREPLDGYAQHLAERGHTAGTTYGYLRLVRAFAREHAGRRHLHPWQVTASDLEDWTRSHQWSRQTRNRATSALTGFYGWAVTTGRLRAAPTAGLAYTHHHASGPARRALPPGWAEPLDAYLIHLRAAGRTEATIATNRDRLAMLAQHVDHPARVTPSHLETWIAATGLSPETRRGRRSTARAFFAWTVRTARLTNSPALYLPATRVPRAVPRPIPAGTLAQALGEADDRCRLAFLLAGCAGLRRAEIAGLRWTDLDLGRGLVVRGKGGHERRVPMHPALTEALTAEHHRRTEGRHGSGFPTPYPGAEDFVFASHNAANHISPRWLGRIAADALPQGWTLHSLRHRFATDAYATQRDLRAVQELLGHTKPETTARYAATPDDALCAAVLGIRDPLHPALRP